MSAARRIVSVLCYLLAASLHADGGKQFSIEVFTRGDRPLQGIASLEHEGIEVKVVIVDDIQRTNRELSANLPGNEQQAIRVVAQRIQRRHAELSQRYKHAAQGLMRAMALQIDRIPAIVFADGKAVVLGITDVGEALKVYQRWHVARGDRR